MARFLPFAHHMEDHIVLRHFEVEVHFHPALVGMGRHRVPYAAGFQHGHAHAQLAGFQHGGMDELVDDSLVACCRVAAGLLGGVRDFDQPVLIAAMRRSGNEIELRGGGGINAFEIYFLRAAGQVQAVFVTELINRVVRGDFSGAADIEHATFPALQEILRTEAVPDIDSLVDGNLFLYGHDAHGDHPVHMAVDGDDLIRFEQFFNQEFLPDFLGGVALEVPLVAAVANVHVFCSSCCVCVILKEGRQDSAALRCQHSFFSKAKYLSALL